jgi:hypothetical protein
MEVIAESLFSVACFAFGYYMGSRDREPIWVDKKQDGHPVILKRPVSRRPPKALDDKRAWELEQKNPER